MLSSTQEHLEKWSSLGRESQFQFFVELEKGEAQDVFASLGAGDRGHLLMNLPESQRSYWLRLLELDEAVDLLQNITEQARHKLLGELDAHTLHEMVALLAFAEDEAGGLMNPKFCRVRPELRIDEALSYVRRQAQDRVLLHYIYVLDNEQRLVGVMSLRQLFGARPDQVVSQVMIEKVISLNSDLDQELVAQLFGLHGLLALPVVDAQQRMQGVITADDVLEVIQSEATEDLQKFGGLEALDVAYMQASFGEMLRKRGGWLAALFLGEMLTATAMGHFESEIAKNVVLALFVPLIISSGGNSGSQASTLVIRAMAVGEIQERDWLRVMGRELLSGLGLGLLLGLIGCLRVMSWHALFGSYGSDYLRVAFTVAFSLVGVVLFGTLAGSMLPFLLRKLRFDPASASAPFVATLVDVTGLIIYFSVARMILQG